MDKIVSTLTFPSLPSSIILKKHLLFSFFNNPGHINKIPTDKPAKKNRALKNFFFWNLLTLKIINSPNLFNSTNKENKKILVNGYKFY